MLTNKEVIELQRGHDIVPTESFASVEQYCVYLMHLKAYQEALKVVSGAAVLDCGCNNGYGAKLLSEVADRVVGVDVSDTAIREARRRYGGDEVEFRVVDGLSLPFADGEFDVVVSFQVIEHVGEYEPYLSEIKRVLRGNGTAVFTTPNRLVRLAPGMTPWNSFHVREFSGDELERLLTEYFTNVTVKGMVETIPPPSVYSVELARVTRVRDENLRWWGLRPKLRAALPPLRHLRRFLRGAAPSGQPSQETLAAFSTEQVRYSQEEVDRAIDLMAICTNATTR